MLTPQQMFDLPLDGKDNTGHIPHWCGNILYVLVTFFEKLLTRYQVIGLENVRAFQGKGGAMLACTHHSFLDPAYIWTSIRPKQWCRMIARDTLFEKNALFSQGLARVGSIPVTRDSADKTAIKRAVKMLKNEELVCIFPEGTRRGKTTTPPLLHGGAALIARMAKVPIIPCCVRNCEKIHDAGELRFHFPKVYVCYGSPIYLEWFDFLPKHDRLDACIWYVMREAFALQEDCDPTKIDMGSLFPDSKDYSQIFSQHPVGKDL